MVTAKFINNLVSESIFPVSPSRIADEILKRYRNEDFKQVIIDISRRTNISKIKLVQIFCNQTGADIGDLPGDYSLHDFIKKPPPPDKGEKPQPIVQIPLLFDK